MSWAEGHGTSQKDNLWFVKATTLMQSGGTVDVEIAANLWALFGAHMNMKVYGQMGGVAGTTGKLYTQIKKNHQEPSSLNPPFFWSHNADEDKQ